MAGKRERDTGRKRCRTASRSAAQDTICPGLEEYVDRIIREAPPFSARQRAAIAPILSDGDPR
jgi:hypothetical protein